MSASTKFRTWSKRKASNLGDLRPYARSLHTDTLLEWRVSKLKGLHTTTFGYLAPTDEQKATMERLRQAARIYAEALDTDLPKGPDKTYVLRKLRELAMWVNVSVTRLPDGTPRE